MVYESPVRDTTDVTTTLPSRDGHLSHLLRAPTLFPVSSHGVAPRGYGPPRSCRLLLTWTPVLRPCCLVPYGPSSVVHVSVPSRLEQPVVPCPTGREPGTGYPFTSGTEASEVDTLETLTHDGEVPPGLVPVGPGGGLPPDTLGLLVGLVPRAGVEGPIPPVETEGYTGP